MMLMLLANRRLCSVILPRFFSCASATPNPDPETKPPTFVLADYLMSSFGFSSDKAVKVSKHLCSLKSPEKPDSVRRFLEDQGFSESDVKKLVTSYPPLLCSSPEKILEPNLRAIRDIGLSTSALNKIILSGPQALQKHATIPRIRFWMDFFDGDESALVTAFKRNLGLVGHDIGRVVSPKISLLRSQGFSMQEIQMILCRVPRFITSKITGMEDQLNRTKELGFQPGSAMFYSGLHAVIFNTRDMLHKKMELLMSIGWSQNDFFAALHKAPTIVTSNEKNLQAKINFLMGEARYEPSYIASHPVFLTLSLSKRLRPRHHIIQLLESKGLCSKAHNFSTIIRMKDGQFVERYILPHKEVIPNLYEEYVAACTSKSG